MGSSRKHRYSSRALCWALPPVMSSANEWESITIGARGEPQSAPLYPRIGQPQSGEWEVTWPAGVAWRRSPTYNDRINAGNEGPNCGTRLTGIIVSGSDQIQYLRVVAGQYLPTTMPDGRQVMKQVSLMLLE